MPSANEAAALAAKAHKLAKQALRQIATGTQKPSDDLINLLRGPRGARGAKGERGKDGRMGQRGLDGLDGPPGQRGKSGRDGVDGKQGPPGPAGAAGKDGRGIRTADITDGVLYLTYTDGQRSRIGVVEGAPGMNASGRIRGGGSSVQFDDYSASEDISLDGIGAEQPVTFSQPVQLIVISTKGVDGEEGYLELDGDTAQEGEGQFVYPNQANYFPTPKSRQVYSIWLPASMSRALVTGYIR